MFRTRTRWLTVAAATLVVGAVLPGSALADTTPGAITGHVLDGTTPMANVTVDVLDSQTFSFAGETSTDATGAFTVSDLAPASYIVSFQLPGGLTQYSRGQLAFQNADAITVAAGATTTDEEQVVTHGSLAGTLTDSSGAPVRDAFVFISPTSFQFFLNARTDTNGHYQVPIAPVGSYTLEFNANGFAQSAHGKPAGQGDTFAVTAGNVTTVDEQLLAPGTFTGRVTTADGLPAAGVEVQANSQVGGQFALTDANGQYTIQTFPGSGYVLAFQRGGFGGGLTQWAHGQKEPFDAQQFSVASGGTTVVDEQLLPTGKVAGHLVDSTGQPVQFGNVELRGADTVVLTNINNGDWSVDTYPGDYTVAFEPFTGITGTQWATGKSSAATADHFTVEVGQTTRVDDTLAAPGTVTVTVVDSVTGAPVSWCGDIGPTFPCSDDTGTATSGPLLPGDTQILIFPRDNHLQINTHATVVSGQNTQLSLTAVPGATITMTVRDAKTGAPLRNICPNVVKVTAPSGASGGIGNCSDADGHVTVPGLAAGSYNVFAFANDGVHGHQWVGPKGGTGIKEKAAVFTVTAGQSIAIPDIKMDKAGTLTGIVRDKATGAAIPNATVSWGTSSAGLGGSSADVSTDANGQYTFTNLGPYDWPIFFHAAGYASEWSGNTGNRLQAHPIKVKAGKTKTHNEVLGQGVTLTGMVTDASGGPIPPFGARITPFNADSGDEIGSDDTANDSTYTLHLLPRQTVILNADLFFNEPAVIFNTDPIAITRPGPIVVNLSPPAA